ncbi:DUF4283 domain protein [Medicago truncatula]|uniref:DUF4283 domain protein n=1 Tax=Medicago truncatula TaxID=3880 RepID=G7I4X3_MEDTR|nr:DUF4283 domain protein [Medicago truncatula]
MAATNPTTSGKSFAQALSGAVSCDSFLSKLPPKVIMGDSVRVKISQAVYESGLAACQCNLHGRLTLHKGDSPLTTQALKVKLNNLCTIEEMKQVWAIGVVNLKPGFMHFSCWTKDFISKAQAQTHAQVWVRLMNLPHEYWGKQTIFEIASGLGSPLTIDDATVNRRFGLFARVLVDVDLANKMFDSVIVEREGHNLGHSIHTCSKMNHETPTNVTRKAHNVNTKAQSKASLNSKKDEETIVHKIAPSSNEAVGKKPAKTQIPSDNMESPSNSITAVEGGETLCDNVTKELVKTMHVMSNQAEIHTTDKNLDDSPVFEVTESAKQASKESVCLEKVTSSEDPCTLEKDSSQLVVLVPNTQVLESDHGRHPMPDPYVDTSLYHFPLVTPITTTDEVLGPDKGKVIITGSSKNFTAASMKSVQILRKFWGDEEDTDPATDSTMDPDTNTEKLDTCETSIAGKYLVQHPHNDSFVKPGRKASKKRVQNHNGKTTDGVTSSEHIQTRSKKGVIKSNPKYV